MATLHTLNLSDQEREAGAYSERRLPSYLQPLPQYLHKRALNLLARLHICLDIEALLQGFKDGLEWSGSELTFSIECTDCHVAMVEDPGERHCQFHIFIDQEYICELGVHSHAALSSEEETQLALWLRVLAYPLRNAIQLHKMRMQVFRDALTGVQNRIALEQSLAREMAAASRHQTELSMLVIDIDHFKRINDQHGHSSGDLALQAAAACLQRCLRNSDQLFRFGGEEFVMLLPHTDSLGAYKLAERVRMAMASKEHLIGDIRLPITISIGVASLAWNDTAESLFERADKALYMAKNAGRNRVGCLERVHQPVQAAYPFPISSQA